MGTCMSKKKRSSSSSSSVSATKLVSSSTPHLQPQAVTVFKSEVEPEREASLKKENKQEDEGRVKKEVFIIKHRKSYSDGGGCGNGREKISKVAAEAKEVDEILLECGRLSRNSSGKAVSSSERGRRRRHSKRSHDFDHCENDNPTTNAIGNIGDLLCEDDNGLAGENRHQLRQHRHRRRSPSERRRRTPSRERDQQQRSSSRERRVSRSPGKRSSDTTTTTCNLTNNNTTTRPGKMLSVPPTVSSLSMDKSNNGGGGGTVRVSVKRNVGSASPRSVSPARANGKLTLLSENQQQQQASSMNRNSSRNAEQSPYRRHPLTEIDGNSLAYSHSANNNSGRFQSRPKREIEPQASQKTKVDTNNMENRTSRVKKKEQQEEEEEVKEQCSMSENVNLKKTTVVPPPSGIDNLKHQTLTLTRSRSSRRSSRDLDHILNNETVGIPSPSYTSLLLEDIQNFHQKNNNNNAPSNPLPACVAKACTILEAVADLNASTTRSNLALNHYAKRVPDCSIKEQPFVETEVDVTDDVMEPSLQKYVTTVSRGDSLIGVGGGLFDLEDKECSASEQRHVGLSSSSSSMKPNSGDLTDFRNSIRRRECDFQRTGSGRFGDIKDVHAIPT